MSKRRNRTEETPETENIATEFVDDVSAALENGDIVENDGEFEYPEPVDVPPTEYNAADANGQVADIEPNIRFIGKATVNGVSKKRIAPIKVKVDGEILTLPDPEKQNEGFFHARAKQIIRAFPTLYKRNIRKGD